MLLYGFFWHNPLGNEYIDQALKWLHVLLGEKIVIHCHSDEVNETAVEFEVAIDMPEGIGPMTVVEVGVAAEHLLDDALDVLVVVLWEAG